MSKKQINQFRHKKRTIPAVITAAAFAATLTAPVSALTPAASSANQVEQTTTSFSASSSSSASQTSSETSSVVSSYSASSSAASDSTASSRTSSAVSTPSSEKQAPVQAGSSSTSSAASSQAPKTTASASSAPKLKDSSSDYTISNGVLISYNGAGGVVTIPSSVTSIGSYSFANCTNLTSVIIPSSVVNIMGDAFDNCTSLKNVAIPNSVSSIGDQVFRDCVSLTSVTIPNSVTSIGDQAFINSGLTSVTIPSSVTSIGNNAFEGTTWLSRQYNSNGFAIANNFLLGYIGSKDAVTIPNGVTIIGDDVFRDCKEITSVIVPNSVVSIGNQAFYDCPDLTSISIPSSVAIIGEEAFCVIRSDGSIEQNPNLTFTVAPNSYAATYAKQNGLSYVFFAPPVITIGQYDGTDPTNKPITVTATTGSDATFSAATGETVSADGHTASYTFSQNGSFTFTAADAAGNTTSQAVTISNIDITPPTITVGQYDGTDLTNKPITVTATTGSDATFSAATGETVSADGHTASYTFSKNGSFTFTATDAAGNMTSKTVTISNIMQSSNAQPLTDIDSPSNGATVNGTVNVSGWVLNSSGINRVDIYAYDSNGTAHSLGSVASKDLTDRTDVAGAFANDGYENINNSGYTLPVDTTQLSSGTYTLAVAGIGNNGVVQWATETINVTTPQPLTDIDAPADGSSINGTVNVSGWVLNASGINRVDIYALDNDGKAHSLGSVASKDLKDRTDVASAFANDGYGNINNSGYTLPVDTTKLAGGTYTLAVAGIGNNGVVQWATKTINVTTPQPLTDIDAPADGSSINSTVNVSGWVLNVSGINRVDVYAFDSNGQPHSLGSVASKDLTDRTDVAGAFANDGYANIDNSGYSLPVDTTKLASGTYTLAVAGIGNNGMVQWTTKAINVTTPQPLTDIDAPADGSSVNGTVNVSGWALNASGIDRVDVYAWDSDGTPHSLGSVESKDLTDRTDVASAFANGGYGNINNSGYTLPVDTTKLDGGTYTLAVAGIGNNGVVQWATKSITVQ